MLSYLRHYLIFSPHFINNNIGYDLFLLKRFDYGGAFLEKGLPGPIKQYIRFATG